LPHLWYNACKFCDGGLCTVQQSYEQRGYLHEDFRVFHLKNAMEERLDWHYHSFHKIIVFLGGTAGYGIEGRSYTLHPGDCVLVPQGCIHRPEANPGDPYERIILYLSPEFLHRNSTSDCPLESCFWEAKAQFRFVLRPERRRFDCAQQLLELKDSQNTPGFGQTLLTQSLLLQFLIGLRRQLDEDSTHFSSGQVRDEKIAQILQYLSRHTTQDITIDDLAGQFYISKYHMMRRFRAETGYTIHAYLTGKRLMLARELLLSGTPVLQAAQAAGFHDYSAFLRAYRRQFSEAPGRTRKDES